MGEESGPDRKGQTGGRGREKSGVKRLGCEIEIEAKEKIAIEDRNSEKRESESGDLRGVVGAETTKRARTDPRI